MNILYCKYSNDRDKKFRIKTVIGTEEGVKSVYKFAVDSNGLEHINNVKNNFEKMQEMYKDTDIAPNKCEAVEGGVKFEFINGRTYESILDDLYKEGKIFEIVEKVNDYKKKLLSLPGNVPFEKTEKFVEVFGDFYYKKDMSLGISNIDFIFANILVNDKWNIIDYEWTFDFPVPIDFIIYRSVYYYVHGNTKRAELINIDIFKMLGISDTDRIMYAQMENAFQNYVKGDSVTLPSLKTTMLKESVPVLSTVTFDNDYIQVYFDRGNGYSENDSLINHVQSRDNHVKFTFDVSNVRSLRIDPSVRACVVSGVRVINKNNEYSITSTNGILFEENICFTGNDPWFAFDNINVAGKIKVSFSITRLNEEDGWAIEKLWNGIEQEKAKNKNLNSHIDDLENQLVNQLADHERLRVENDAMNSYLNNLRGKFAWRVMSAGKKTAKSLVREGLITTTKKVGRKVKNKIRKNQEVPAVTPVQPVTPVAVNVQNTANKSDKEKILFVIHESQKAGASLLSLNMIKSIKSVSNYEVVMILIAGGPLTDEFKKLGKVYELNQPDFKNIYNEDYVDSVINEIAEMGVKHAICNSVVTGILVPKLKEKDIAVISLVHELSTSIFGYGFDNAARCTSANSDYVVFAAKFVRDRFVENFTMPMEKCIVLPQGVYSKLKPSKYDAKAVHKKNIEKQYGITANSQIVLGCGYGNFRKGLDWFGSIAVSVMSNNPDTHFVWLGGCDAEFEKWINNDLKTKGLTDRFHWIPFVEQPEDFFGAADVFLLSSREDPFPSVVLESMIKYTPVVAFENAGGSPEILTDGRGIVVPYGDCEAAVKEINILLKDVNKCNQISEKAQAEVRKMSINNYVKDILNVITNGKAPLKVLPDLRVSVVIPNYNYAHYLPERLDGILNQTVKPYEIIFLDDVSKDNSVEVASKILEESGIKYSVYANTENKGCFKQWLNGIRHAEGEIVWVAEADDLCEPTFIERLLPFFADDQVNLAYGQSEVIFEHGEHSGYVYTQYTDEMDPVKWHSDYVNDGQSEIVEGLGIKNTIPNASGTLIRKSAFDGIDEILSQFSVAGDWMAYVYALKTGKIAFCSDILNYHRRHSTSIIAVKEHDIRLFVEILKTKMFIAENFLIPQDKRDEFVAFAKTEFDRLSKDNYDDYKELQELQEAVEKKVDETISKYPFLQNKPRKNILYVIPDFEMGGGQTLVVRLANYFSRFHNVYLYNARPWLHEERIEKMIAGRVHVLDSNGTPEQLSQYIDNYKIEIINDHIWWSDKIVYLAAKDKDVQIVLSMHGCYEALMEHPDWDPDFDGLVEKMFNRANRIIYATNKNKKIFERVPVEEKACRIYYGYELENIAPVNRSEYGIDEDSFVFGVVARGIKEKGFGEAAEAFEKLISENDVKADLVLVGNGPFIDGLKEKYAANKKIHFIDNLKKPSAWIGWVKIFDCAMLPTYFISESLPNSVIEYLAYGKPVISTDIGDIKYMLTKDNVSAGIVLDLKNKTVDSDDLAAAMKTMITDKEKYNSSVEGAKEMFKQFDIKNFAVNYYDQYLKK